MLCLSLTIVSALVALVPFTPANAAPHALVPVIRNTHPQARAIQDSYIVKIKAESDIPVSRRSTWLNNVMLAGGATLSTSEMESLKLGWNKTLFDGISGTFNAAALNAIRANKDVEYIVEDTEMYISATLQQSNAPWGLARLSQRATLTDQNPAQLNFRYTFDDSGGTGVDIYIVDTGVRITHRDFGGRATFGASFGSGVPGQDLNGHGTHTAGTAAGNVLGVAKSANIIAVKVMADDGSGATSDIISGLNFATNSASQSGRPSVINLSIGGPTNQALDAAVLNAVNSGVHVVVAAGNESQDANNVSPARVPEVITVGAINIADQQASFSNFGTPVDIFAPGQDILSAGHEADDQVRNLSGTSMACPHIAGLAAYFIGLEGNKSPAELRDRLVSVASTGVVINNAANTVNVLANNGIAVEGN